MPLKIFKKHTPADEPNEASSGPPPSITADGGPPPVDKRLPFAVYRDVFTLKNYWKTISRKAEECSKLLLQRHLQKNPECKKLYPKLQSLNVNDETVIAENTAFETTATAYLSVFDDVMSEIDANQVDKAIKKLTTVGKKHKGYAGCTVDLFQCLEEPFLYMVSEALQDRYNDKSEALFRKFFQFCLKYLTEGFNE